MLSLRLPIVTVAGIAALLLGSTGQFNAANHREAPITALDRLADITDFFAFVSYDDPTKVTLILNVDPLLEPSNGPNYFPFDPEILYEIKVDNNHDAVEDVTFQFRFQTEIRLPAGIPRRIAEGIYTTPLGIDGGRTAPPGGPAGAPPGTPIIPNAVTSLDGPGSEGITIRQTYRVSMVRGRANGRDGDDDGHGKGHTTDLTNQRLIALPSNNGPRTIPDYPSLFRQAIYDLGDGIRVYAGTSDDPFFIDLGAAFDTLNLRETAGVLVPAQDANDFVNTASDDVSGFNVNVIAIEVPIALLTSTGRQEPATRPAATIGTWGTTSRPQITIRRTSLRGNGGDDRRDDDSPDNRAPTFNEASTFTGLMTSGRFRQVQRMGNALFNELIIGNGFKDTFSVSEPRNDIRFVRFPLDPYMARQINALFPFIMVPDPPRNDLRPLIQYLPPIAAPGTPPGPVADLLRLNTGVPPTPFAARSRLGLVGLGPRRDQAGYPNGRRVTDDVTDITVRLIAGVFNPAFNRPPNNVLGDAVNVNDTPQFETFPYVWFSHDGRNSRHIDPGEPGCTMGFGPPCPPPNPPPAIIR